MANAVPLRRCTPVAVLLTMILACLLVSAQAPRNLEVPRKQTQQVSVPPPPEIAHELTAADVEAFLDGLVPLQIQRADIAGAVVCVVKDGKVLFAKSYGYADEKKKTPVSVDETLFRPGSISKLFTWTAVMQLVEQGKLDLDRDVNDYLDFKISPKFGKPITLRNIMTHTPGFEESIKDLIQPNEKLLMPLGDYLRTHMPSRIFPPGTVPAYSNYATGLAGYIVQRVSGVPYEQYIQDNILTPLQMTHASFAQPLPEVLKPLMSQGYKRASEGAKEFEYVQPAPAGALAVSAGDMAKFMIAHLQGGQYGNARILEFETVQLMHSREFGLVPNMNGMALGFYEESRNGQRIIGHGGDTVYFHSDLHLIQDANLGFFVSYNSAGRSDDGSSRTPLWNHFLDRYFPYTPAAAPQVASAKADAQSIAGTYIASRRADDNILRATAILGEMKVSVKPDGKIVADSINGLNGKPKQWEPIGGLEYRDSVNQQDHMAFVRDASGRTQIVVDFPAITFFRVPWYQSKGFILPAFIATLAIFVLTLVLWIVAGLVRLHYDQPLPLTGPERSWRRRLRIVVLIDLIALSLWLAWGMRAIDNVAMLSSRAGNWIHVMQAITLIGAIGTIVALIALFAAWASAQRVWWSRVLETVVVLACFAYLWIVISWDLLTFRLHY